MRLTTTLLALAAAAAAAPALAQEPAPAPDPVPADPCAEDLSLLCPDLTMAPPSRLDVARSPGGRLILRAENRIVNVGAGPMEVRARRATEGGTFGPAYQVIRRREGAPRIVPGAGAVTFKFVDEYRGSYWKYAAAARFELWRTDAAHRRTELRRTGPKLAYCFRDLERVRPLAGSPRRRVYPACTQRRTPQQVRLGTSVGWADIYPAPYPENWIDITGLRGCYAFVHRADPGRHLAEEREDNNLGVRRISLPPQGGSVAPRGACR